MSNIPIISVQGVIGVGNNCTDLRQRGQELSIVEKGRGFFEALRDRSKIRRFEFSGREISRELIRNIIHPTIYIYMFLTENLVTLFTGNSRNNFIGRVAMNIAYVKRVHILFRIL